MDQFQYGSNQYGHYYHCLRCGTSEHGDSRAHSCQSHLPVMLSSGAGSSSLTDASQSVTRRQLIISEIGYTRLDIQQAKSDLAANGYAKIRFTSAHRDGLMIHFNQHNESTKSRKQGTASVLSKLHTESPYMRQMTNIMEQITGHTLRADEDRCNIRQHSTMQTSHHWHYDAYGLIATSTPSGNSGVLFIKPGTQSECFLDDPDDPVYPDPKPGKNIPSVTEQAGTDEMLIFFGKPEASSSNRGKALGLPTLHRSPDEVGRTVTTLRWSAL